MFSFLKSFFRPRRRRKSERLEGVPPTFEHAFYRNSASDELIVVLSPAIKPARYIEDARNRNALYLADTKFDYYTRSTAQAVTLINGLIEANGIRKTLFIGGSKAGFGALLYVALCAKANPAHPFRCLAFSPHATIYPENPRLNVYVTYRSLLARAKRNPRVLRALKRHSSAKICENVENARIVVFYGEGNHKDREEAASLSGGNIRKFPIPVTFHNTLTPLVIKEAPRERREAVLRKIFNNLQKHEEARQSIPPTLELFAKEIADMTWLPSMKEMIEEVMAD